MTTLDLKNYGKPTCPDIVINPPRWGSKTEPQAYEDNGNWFYNYAGAMKEAEFTGKTLPTVYELTAYLREDEVRDTVEYLGYINDGMDQLFNAGKEAYFWSSTVNSPRDDEDAKFVYVLNNNPVVYPDFIYRGQGLSLRFASSVTDV